MKILIGDLVIVAFEEAGNYCTDQREVSRLAMRILRYLLRSTRVRLLPSDTRYPGQYRRLAARSTCCND